MVRIFDSVCLQGLLPSQIQDIGYEFPPGREPKTCFLLPYYHHPTLTVTVTRALAYRYGFCSNPAPSLFFRSFNISTSQPHALCFLNPLSPVSVASMYMDVGPPSTSMWTTYQGLHTWRKLTLPKKPSASNISLTVGGTSWILVPFMLEFWLALFCACLIELV